MHSRDPLESVGRWWDRRQGAAAAAFALFALLAAPPAARGQVILSEVLYDAEGVDAGRQVVELQNLGGEEAAIGGFWLSMKLGQSA